MGLALWLAWPRRAKATQEEALEALEWLRAECAAIFADVAATVARVGVRDSALGAYTGFPEDEENSAKVRQAIEQPLVLQAAMHEAASRAAGALPAGSGSADDLEAALQLFSQDRQAPPSLARPLVGLGHRGRRHVCACWRCRCWANT